MRTFPVYLQTGDDQDIQNAVSKLMQSKCTEQAKQNSDLFNDLVKQVKLRDDNQLQIASRIVKSIKPEEIREQESKRLQQVAAIDDEQYLRLSNCETSYTKRLEQSKKSEQQEQSSKEDKEDQYKDIKPRYNDTKYHQKRKEELFKKVEEDKQNYLKQQEEKMVRPSLSVTEEKALNSRKQQAQNLIQQIQEAQKAIKEYEDYRKAQVEDQQPKNQEDNKEENKEENKEVGDGEKKEENAEGGEQKQEDQPNEQENKQEEQKQESFTIDFKQLGINIDNPTFEDIRRLTAIRDKWPRGNEEMIKYKRMQEEKQKEDKILQEHPFEYKMEDQTYQQTDDIKDPVQRLYTKHKVSQEKIRKNRINQRLKERENNTFKPKIDERSAAIATKNMFKNQIPEDVYHRLQVDAKVRHEIKPEIENFAEAMETQYNQEGPSIPQGQKFDEMVRNSRIRHLNDSNIMNGSMYSQNNQADNIPTGGEVQRCFADSLRIKEDEIKDNASYETGDQQKWPDRLLREGQLHNERRRRYEEWGESLSVLMSNTVHTGKRSTTVLQRQEHALRIYDQIAYNNKVTGQDVLNNLNLFESALRRPMEDLGRLYRDRPVTEGEFVNAYLGAQ